MDRLRAFRQASETSAISLQVQGVVEIEIPPTELRLPNFRCLWRSLAIANGDREVVSLQISEIAQRGPKRGDQRPSVRRRDGRQHADQRADRRWLRAHR